MWVGGCERGWGGGDGGGVGVEWGGAGGGVGEAQSVSDQLVEISIAGVCSYRDDR